MTRFCVVGPTHPFRGGIAHYTTLLVQQLRKEHETLLISFRRQYPRWLFPGRSDRDPSRQPLRAEAEYLLDPLNPLSWRRTYRRIQEWGPEIVVMPWWVPFWAPAWAVLGRVIKRLPARPKLIFICHNVLPHEKGRLDRTALRLALSPADGYIVHSEQDARRLRHEFPEVRVQVTPHPTYASLGQGDTVELPVELPADRPLLIFFGFIRHYKGLDVLLEALSRVERPFHLLIVGEFWEDKGRYLRQIDRLRLRDKVTVIDEYVPDEQLATYVGRADVAVLPYRSATQSGVIQVAFGQGTPVITTNVGGLAEVVEDGRTGLIVPSEDSQALADSINRFFDEDLAPRFKVNIRADEHRFDWRPLVEQMLLLSRPA